jgi:hypothetical protein
MLSYEVYSAWGKGYNFWLFTPTLGKFLFGQNIIG